MTVLETSYSFGKFIFTQLQALFCWLVRNAPVAWPVIMDVFVWAWLVISGLSVSAWTLSLRLYSDILKIRYNVIASVVGPLKDEIRELNKMNAHHSRVYKGHAEEKRLLQNQIDALDHELSRIGCKTFSNTGEVVSLQHQIKMLKAQWVSPEVANRLNANNQQLRQRIAELESQLLAMNGNHETASRDSSATLTGLQAQLTEKEKRLASLLTERDTLNHQIGELTGKAARLITADKEINVLRGQVSSQQTEIDKLRLDIDKFRRERDTFWQAGRNLAAQMEQMDQAGLQLQNRVQDLNSRLVNEESQRKNAENSAASYKTQAEKLNKVSHPLDRHLKHADSDLQDVLTARTQERRATRLSESCNKQLASALEEIKRLRKKLGEDNGASSDASTSGLSDPPSDPDESPIPPGGKFRLRGPKGPNPNNKGKGPAGGPSGAPAGSGNPDPEDEELWQSPLRLSPLQNGA